MVRTFAFIALLLVAGSVGCGNVTVPLVVPSDGWVEIASPGGGNVLALAVIGTNLFAGTGSGVFRSTDDGTSWTAVNNGLPATPLNVGGLVVSGTNLYAAITPDVFAGTPGRGVFRSTDNGASWTAINNGLPTTDVRTLAVRGTSLFAGTSACGTTCVGRVFRSNDDGANWTAADNGLVTTGVPALAVSGTSLFAGTFEEGVFRSTDDGANWTAVNSGFPAGRVGVSSFGVSGASLFAGILACDTISNTCTFRMFRSTDNGASWTAADTGVSGLSIRAFAASGTSLFVGTQGLGVYRSTDDGAEWKYFGPARRRLITMTAMAVSGANLVAGSFHFGLWRRPL